jgi:hypothetical protein
MIEIAQPGHNGLLFSHDPLCLVSASTIHSKGTAQCVYSQQARL